MPEDAFGQRLMSEGCLFGTTVILSPVLLNDSVRRSFAYHKLPQQLLKLSVLKLDGSFFDVHVPKTATVGELKKAIEDVFSELPMGKEINISWSHVWGHFFLSYKGYKLINDKEYIRIFGINDGDQLHFVNHLSDNYEREKRRSEMTRLHQSFSDYERVVPWNEYTREFLD